MTQANVLARWRIHYRTDDEQGEPAIVVRTIRITRVQPTLRRFHAWCELKHAERTFSLFSIARAFDLDEGVEVIPELWLEDYRKSRRKGKSSEERAKDHEI